MVNTHPNDSVVHDTRALAAGDALDAITVVTHGTGSWARGHVQTVVARYHAGHRLSVGLRCGYSCWGVRH